MAVGISNGVEVFLKNFSMLSVIWLGGYLISKDNRLTSG